MCIRKWTDKVPQCIHTTDYSSVIKKGQTTINAPPPRASRKSTILKEVTLEGVPHTLQVHFIRNSKKG